jgi:hypothetical protein
MTASLSDFDDEAPRKKGRPRKVQQITKSEYVDDGEDDEKKDEAFSGLFDETTLKSINRVRVIRKEPNEGTVGYLEDPMLGEAEIFERWGGSTYLIQALNMKGQTVKVATLKIAGDPIFVSKVAEMQWRRSRGLPQVAAENPGAAATPAMSLQEIMLMMQQADERRRQEERDHKETLRKIEVEAQALQRREAAEYADRVRREQIEADARLRRDEEERDRRRAKDEEDRETRRRRDQAEAEARQQQFMQQTIQMLQQSSAQALNFVKATAQPQQGNNLMDAVKTVVAIKEAFAGEGDGGEETPMNLLIKHGGEWISGLSNGIAGAVREIKGGGVAPATQQPRASNGVPSTAGPATSPLALLPAEHPINEKVETLIAKLAAKGLDPIEAMSAIIDNVTKDVDKIPQQGAPRNGVAAATDAPKPFTHDPNTVARVEAPAAPTPVSEPVRVYRHSFGR